MVKERVKDWVEEQKQPGQPGKMPKNILYYRDGVSESQYSAVRDLELPHIRTAYSSAFDELVSEGKIKEYENSKTVNLTAIVVAKRHHVRFYPAPKGRMDKDNCYPGTYVDNVVTPPYFQDFYLQSHTAIKGTARPAHYFVLVNEMKRDIDFYRRLVSLKLGEIFCLES